MTKRILGSIALAVVSVAITFVLAFGACAFEWTSWANRAVTVPLTFGKSTPSEDGLAWYWFASKSRMRSDVVSIAVPTNDVQRWIAGYKPPQSRELPEAPWWTVSREQSNPPKRETPPELIAADDLPRVGDVGFGWPLPCIAYRVNFLDTRKATTDEKAAMVRVVKPDQVTKFVREPTLAYGRFSDSLFVDSGHSGYWPNRILWPNLMIDWIAIAGLLLLPLASHKTFVAFRQRGRRRRGECPGCGYPSEAISLGEPCPECGNIPTARPPLGLLSPPKP